jgi:hypothetical protein
MLLVMMALMMGLNALMGLVERHALRWRTEAIDPLQRDKDGLAPLYPAGSPSPMHEPLPWREQALVGD